MLPWRPKFEGKLTATITATVDVGVTEHLGGTNGGSQSLIDFYNEVGIRAFRTGIAWSEVEVTKGQYAITTALDAFILQARSVGKEPLFILCCANQLYDGGGFPVSAAAQDAFAQYATFIARHYKGAVMRYEVWNEWDIGLGVPGHPLGDPIVYTSLLQKVYRALKAVDPNITVIAGATSGRDLVFADTVFKNGGLTAMDVWSAHPYVYPDPPENAMLDGGSIANGSYYSRDFFAEWCTHQRYRGVRQHQRSGERHDARDC